MKKFLSLLMAAVMTASLLAGCGGNAAPAPSGSAGSTGSADAPGNSLAASAKLVFSTGGDQGTYYGFGSVLAQYVSSNTDVNITAVTSGGSKANIEALDLGEAHLGFVQTDVMAYAYEGTNLFADYGAVTNFSTVAALYGEQVQIVTLDPNIKTVADLKGKNVSIGANGSGVFFNAVDILNAYGLDYEKDISPTYQSFGDSVDSIQDGKIDAAFVVAGAPTTAITSLATGKQVYLVNLDDEHINKLLETSPYYTKSIIPANTYEGIATDTVTVEVGAVIIAADTVSEDAVYAMLSTIFENVDAITQQHAKGAELKLDYAAGVASVPYHAGAAKYFAEKGLTVPTK